MVDRGRASPVNIAILAFDGCLTSAVTGLVDTFRIAGECARALPSAPARCFVTVVRSPASRPVRGSGGFAIPVAPTQGAGHVDIAIVPPIAAPLLETVAENPALVRWIRRTRAPIVASVCSGAFFLAEAGLLRGRRATLNPLYAEAFRRAHVDVELVTEERLVDEGGILCAGSTTAFLDLAIYLVDRFVGHEVAVLAAKSLCMDMGHRSQLPYFVYVGAKDHGDGAVLGLQSWLEDHCTEPLSALQLARRAAMSQRTLNRRFRGATGVAPLDYLHRLRIERAKRLLETSDLPVDHVTVRVGYENARSFSRLFRSLVGLSPREYRDRFGSQRLLSQRRPPWPWPAVAPPFRGVEPPRYRCRGNAGTRSSRRPTRTRGGRRGPRRSRRTTGKR